MNLILGLFTILACTVIQSAVVVLVLGWLRKLHAAQRFAGGFLHDFILLCSILFVLLAGNLIQVGIWALVYVACGEFGDFSTAYYFSLVSFTTLGYGDIVISGPRAILGPLEATNGILMMGLSTSFLFAVMGLLAKVHWRSET